MQHEVLVKYVTFIINKMYIVTKDSSFNNLCSRITTSINQHPKSFISYIGLNHNTTFFEMAKNDIINITFVNEQNNDTFVIPLIYQQVQYQISLQKIHKNYKEYVDDYRNITKTNVLKHSEDLIGIRICDIIKYFILTNNIIKLENSTLFEKYDKNFKTYMISLIKKILRTDFAQFENKNSIGVIDFIQNRITLWTRLMEENLINKCNFNFNDYFQKIIYFSPYMYGDCITIPFLHIYYFNNDKFSKLLTNISNELLMFKFIRHFKYNEDPNLDENIYAYYFDPPKKIPEVLLEIYEITKDNDYKRMYDMMTKQLNKYWATKLETTYADYVVSSIEKITSATPFYALKNIYVAQWDIYDICTLNTIYRRTCIVLKSKYYKHKKITKSKYIPYDVIEQHSEKWNCNCWNKHNYWKSKLKLKEIGNDFYI